MSFNGNEGEQISLEEGAQYTGRYRTANPGAVTGVFFGKDHIQKILAQDDCQGLRFYFASNVDGSQTLVMVGADSTENDLLTVIVERAISCPPYCGGTNPLNSATVTK